VHSNDRAIIGKQIESDPLMSCVGEISKEDDLVKMTRLKLMLTDKNEDKPFVTVNVITDEIKVNFSGTYKANNRREKAREHIKALLEDASHIRIVDKYLARDRCWAKCKEILKQILPEKHVRIIISTTSEAGDAISGKKKKELQNLYNEWEVKGQKFNDSQYHDRYIETDKVKIILSSGVENLSDDGKDLTYVVEVKEKE